MTRSETILAVVHTKVVRNVLLEKNGEFETVHSDVVSEQEWTASCDHCNTMASCKLSGDKCLAHPRCPQCSRELNGYRGPLCRYCDGTAV